ncbi:unnamed protein product [Prunus armeniaca]|uniref:Aminotransferase-like plant mobile domain-containing protein n=1 Tax=Prunus armeniaca TaxID=36596 RepID=A0A6J5TXQ2_PRUAR|nr:unnamed protein product [Prunus armeniaca]
MVPLFKDQWMLNGIYQAIMLSKHQVTLNPSLISAALCFWDSTSNSFAFGPGPMTPTVLDVAALFGFRPHGLSIDAVSDFKLKNRKVRVPMKARASEIMHLRTYSGFVMTYQGVDDPDQEHMMFLLFWLNKFIFPHADEGVRTEFMYLAEALHNKSDLATGPFMLASLYHCLYRITVDPFDLNVCGPIWMLQMWLEWYFPELGSAGLEFLEEDVQEGDAPAIILATRSRRLVSTAECFIFFRECRQCPKAIWLRSLLGSMFWFAERGLHEAPRHWKHLLDFQSQLHVDMSVSCLSSRDIFFGRACSDRTCTYGAEAYNPQYASRQFGLVQAIPELLYSSINRGSSRRNMSMTPQEIGSARSSGRSRGERMRVPPYDPSPLCTSAFHEFWQDRLSSWLPESAKLFYASTFQDCPFAILMTEQEEYHMQHNLVHYQGEAIIETATDELCNPDSNGKPLLISFQILSGTNCINASFVVQDAIPDDANNPILPPSSLSPSSVPSPRSLNKGKAPLECPSEDDEDSDDDDDETPLQRKRIAPDRDSIPVDVASKRARVESSADTDEALLVGPEEVSQRPGKEEIFGPFVSEAPKMVVLKVRTIKLEDGVDLPPYQSPSELDRPDSAAAAKALSRLDPLFRDFGMPGTHGSRSEPSFSRPHGPRSEHSSNLTSAAGKRIIMELNRSDVVLANAVHDLRSLWNIIRAPEFDPVTDPDTLFGMLPQIHQIALVKPHLGPTCKHMEQWLSRTLKHICIIKEILPAAKDPEEILEDHWDRKEGFVDLDEATEKVLDQLDVLEKEEEGLRADISADLQLKAEMEAKLKDIWAQITASGSTAQEITSRAFRAWLARKMMVSARRALDIDMEELAHLIVTILEFLG